MSVLNLPTPSDSAHVTLVTLTRHDFYTGDVRSVLVRTGTPTDSITRTRDSSDRYTYERTSALSNVTFKGHVICEPTSTSRAGHSRRRVVVEVSGGRLPENESVYYVMVEHGRFHIENVVYDVSLMYTSLEDIGISDGVQATVHGRWTHLIRYAYQGRQNRIRGIVVDWSKEAADSLSTFKRLYEGLVGAKKGGNVARSVKDTEGPYPVHIPDLARQLHITRRADATILGRSRDAAVRLIQALNAAKTSAEFDPLGIYVDLVVMKLQSLLDAHELLNAGLRDD